MNRELKTSVKILKELHNGLEEITSAGKQSYQYYVGDPSGVHQTMMSCVYAYLIIRASAFLDELERHFEKHYGREDKSVNIAIRDYKRLFKTYHVKQLRNYVAHNRKVVAKKGSPKKHLYIVDRDLKKFNKLSSPVVFESFAAASGRLIQAITEMQRPAAKKKAAKKTIKKKLSQ